MIDLDKDGKFMYVLAYVLKGRTVRSKVFDEFKEVIKFVDKHGEMIFAADCQEYILDKGRYIPTNNNRNFK